MKAFRFPPLLGRENSARSIPEHEAAAHYFIAQATQLVNDLEQLANAVQVTHPATARHVRLLSQQYASLAVTAVQTWPEAVSSRHE
ncbi:hypothetical protein [Arthrobacter sp. CJ23]|uniref:hypothetical protein n=1 Tax=Arthrobacter sp. CJ23 TaxID=2972479 RepID=UPI00215C606A|nr:hypothetical protein [Arthrobacter sp. CJ23]UVJ38059.1 hypothetical protein NVV90_12390 [Arthrobacter sp. CJ23]